jgi:hypothetical protein
MLKIAALLALASLAACDLKDYGPPEPTARAVTLTRSDLQINKFLGPSPVLLGSGATQPVVIVIDSSGEEGGPPPDKYFKPELPGCQVGATATCCFEQTRWVHADQGWINTEKSCVLRLEQLPPPEPIPIRGPEATIL